MMNKVIMTSLLALCTLLSLGTGQTQAMVHFSSPARNVKLARKHVSPSKEMAQLKNLFSITYKIIEEEYKVMIIFSETNNTWRPESRTNRYATMRSGNGEIELHLRNDGRVLVTYRLPTPVTQKMARPPEIVEEYFLPATEGTNWNFSLESVTWEGNSIIFTLTTNKKQDYSFAFPTYDDDE